MDRKEREVKKKALKILEDVEKGEQVSTSVVHLSETANIVEARLGLKKALELLENILATENIDVIQVSRKEYEESLTLAYTHQISPNDALAVILCNTTGIREIYSFDRHFDNAPSIKRIH